jgi:uncharacterized membrane protein YhaH (DUF805 family)
MSPVSILDFLGSTRGRLSRKGLALGALLPFIVLMAVVDALDDPWITAVVWLLIAWPLFIATPWRRLHDQGRSGRWNVIFLFFYAIGFAFFLGEYVPAEGGWARLFDGEAPRTVDDELTAGGLGGLSTVLIFLPIHLFWLYVMPSARGDNRYGPPPRPKE